LLSTVSDGEMECDGEGRYSGKKECTGDKARDGVEGDVEVKKIIFFPKFLFFSPGLPPSFSTQRVEFLASKNQKIIGL